MDKAQTAQQRAQAKYDAKRKKMTVSFNPDTEQDLLHAATAMPRFSAWVKEQLKSHIKQCSKIKNENT